VRVLQVSSYAPPHLGGLETCAAGLFSGLRERDVQVRWLFSDVPSLPPSPETIRIPASNLIERLTGIPVPIPSLSSLSQFAREVRSADVVHVHDLMYLNSVFAVAFARWFRKPVLITLHIWRVPYRNPLLRAVQAIAHRVLGSYCLKHASLVVACNREVARNLDAVAKSETRFIANAMSDGFRVPEEEISRDNWRQLRDSLALPAADHVVLFAGRFVSKKGLHLIRAVAARMPDVFFVMCGSGPIDPKTWRLRNVRVAGPLPQDALKKYFLASDLLLLPSRGEGFPMVIPEAMACGLPCSILPETWAGFGEHSELFLLLDETRIEQQLEEFLKSAPDFERRRAISAFARSQWSRSTAVDQYLDAYASVRSHAEGTVADAGANQKWRRHSRRSAHLLGIPVAPGARSGTSTICEEQKGRT